jgi:hypothetical protein
MAKTIDTDTNFGKFLPLLIKRKINTQILVNKMCIGNTGREGKRTMKSIAINVPARFSPLLSRVLV